MDFSTFVAQNPLTLFNTLLLVVTGYLSYTSYVFQKRTGVRESLEQLEDVEYGSGKLRPILHRFEFIPFLRKKVEVQLKYYHFGNSPASAGVLNDLFQKQLYHLNGRDSSYSEYGQEEFSSDIERALNSLDYCDSASVDSEGIVVMFQTTNAVEIRRRANLTMQKLYEMRSTDRGEWKEAISEVTTESE